MKQILSLCIGCQFCFISLRSVAQNFETIGKENGFQIAGGFSLNQILYSSFGHNQRRDPYSIVAAGNLSIGIFGWTVPFAFSVSNKGNTYQQPFNQYSLHPTYKSIRAHAGYVSQSFSPYTVNGHLFLGGAVDYEPESPLSVSAFYGRLLKAVRFDSLLNQLAPVYERWGYGAKLGYQQNNYSIQFNVFHAEDDPTSVGYIPDSLQIHPQENLAIALAASKTFFNKIVVKGEYAASAVSSNTMAEHQRSEQLLSSARPLFTPRLSSAYYSAFKAGVDYQLKNFMFGVSLEHVDPGYRTFGAYYFNNDLESIALNVSTALAEGKASITASLGSQRDNLDKAKVSTMTRSVASVALNYAISERLNVSGSYSTFQTYTNIQSQFQKLNQLSPFENLDTLNYTQLSLNATSNFSYQFGRNEQRKQNVSFNGSLQGASDSQSQEAQNSGAYFYNANTAYHLNVQNKGITLSVSLNASWSEMVDNNSRTFGPVASIGRTLLDKKLRVTVSGNFNTTQTNKVATQKIFGSRVGATLALKKVHHVNVSSNVTYRTSPELTAMIGYSYSFAKTLSNPGKK